MCPVLRTLTEKKVNRIKGSLSKVNNVHNLFTQGTIMTHHKASNLNDVCQTNWSVDNFLCTILKSNVKNDYFDDICK